MLGGRQIPEIESERVHRSAKKIDAGGCAEVYEGLLDGKVID